MEEFIEDNFDEYCRDDKGLFQQFETLITTHRSEFLQNEGISEEDA